MKNHLELFSGTHSFGKITSKKGFNVYSLDLNIGAECPLKEDYKSKHHYKEDILTWDYKQFKPGFFNLITASPPCCLWSRLRNCWIGRKLKHMDRNLTKEDIENDINKYGKPIVDKVREIIKYFNPQYWLIENPNTSKMTKYITDLPYYIMDYCKYSNWGYQKRTRFWTNIKGFEPKLCKKDCENILTIETKQHKKVLANGYEMIDGKKVICNTKALRDKMRKQKIHKNRMGTSKTVMDKGKVIRVNTAELRKKYKDFKNIQPTKKTNKKNFHSKTFGSYNKNQKCVGGGTNRLERYRIPPKLIEDIFKNL